MSGFEEKTQVSATLYNENGDPITVTQDGNVFRLEINGKVSVVGQLPPPNTNPVLITAGKPLQPASVGTHDTIFSIPDGEVFHLQDCRYGNEGGSARNVSIEIIYFDGTEHLLELLFCNGSTIQDSFTDESVARDGTSMIGNAVGTNLIIVRRMKFTGANLVIDAEVGGFTVAP